MPKSLSSTTLSTFRGTCPTSPVRMFLRVCDAVSCVDRHVRARWAVRTRRTMAMALCTSRAIRHLWEIALAAITTKLVHPLPLLHQRTGVIMPTSPLRTRVFAPSAMSMFGSLHRQGLRLSGARDAKTFVRGPHLEIRDWPPSASGVGNDNVRNMRCRRRRRRRPGVWPRQDNSSSRLDRLLCRLWVVSESFLPFIVCICRFVSSYLQF
mmetsp:Transcript_555/g.1052  ORF Transcript_555/g.1052 Transcript_555/m.1052 type:complete len:209 (+) Transcript_555:365-991(+)